MTQDQLDILNITQQVLRPLMLALAGHDKTHLHNVGTLLEAAATNGAIAPLAQQMLADLAAGAFALSGIGNRKQ